MVPGRSERLRLRDSVTIHMVVFAALVIMLLTLLVMPGARTFERRQVTREVTDSRAQPQTLAGHRPILPRLRHAIIRLRRAVQQRLHNAIHWLRVYRHKSNRPIQSDGAALRAPSGRTPHHPNPSSPTALPPTGRGGAKREPLLVFFQTNHSLFSRSGGVRWEKRAGVMRVLGGRARGSEGNLTKQTYPRRDSRDFR